MSMEDYIISQLYLKLDKMASLLNDNKVDEVKLEIQRVRDELEKYGQDSKKVSK